MIKKLRFKFIALSMMALFVLLSIIVTGMNIINYNAIIAEADDTLSILARNGGVFPNFEENNKNIFPHNMSPEAPYEARYFSVLLNADGDVLQTNTGKIKAVDTKQAIIYAKQIISNHKSKGFIGSYRYIFNNEGSEMRITFLDCSRSIYSFRTFLSISIAMALAGYLIFFSVILFFSNKIIQPVCESYEKQKRFITDAGHEIKTPLTIIKADADVLEMEIGENEWLIDVQKQADRLTSLTNDLVYLSRMEETNNSMEMIAFPFSDVVNEAAASFQTFAQAQGKTFLCKIPPMLSLKGNEKAIHQLVTILLDNALKYSTDHGSVSLTVEKHNKNLQISVINTIECTIPKEKLQMLFERFYRIDSSRNSQTGGHGIGLSIAKAIVNAHNGKIMAENEDGPALKITVILPT